MADAHVGLVYDALRRSPFAENTLVLFAADHGEGMGHHGRILKNFLEEESWRVPTIMVPPGSGRERSEEERLVSSLDIPATICDYAGVPPLPDADVGRSLRSLTAGSPSSWRTFVFGETEHSAAVQDGRWKAIFYPRSPTRMFDLEDDPLETRNLAALPAYKAELDRLAESLRSYVRGRAVYSRLGENAPGVDRSGQTRNERLRKARIWYESIAEGSGLAV
jgi:choline-sulfatase